MYEHGPKTNLRDSAAKTGTTAADRRNADRHTFTASAEVIELSSGARFSTRTTDLGPGGCFVDTMVPFPVGASVRVTVRKGQTSFETAGVVVYSQTGLGMGIAFDTMEPNQRQALDTWLMELTGSKHPPVPAPAAHSASHTAPASGARHPVSTPALTRLVKLMITKGMITEAEGASVLHDPVL